MKKNWNLTKKLYIDLKKHIGNVHCDCSIEEWYLVDIVSKLTIKFLIDYDLDNTYIFIDFDCWNMVYCIYCPR